MRAVALLLASCLAVGCSREAQPGTFEKFIWNPPNREEMCADSNVGKRFWLDGYLQLPESLEIEDRETELEFFSKIDKGGEGEGHSITIHVTSPGDIDDLWAAAEAKRSGGLGRQEAQIDADALRIRAKNGTATARDKIRLTLGVRAIRHFQTNELTACTYHFEEAEKI